MSKKIAFFDMDGTLIGRHNYDKNSGSTVWSKIARELGADTLEKKRKINNMWYNDHIETYPEWVNKTLDLFSEEGMTRETFESVATDLQYNNGVEKAFKKLNSKDIITVIITGGFRASAKEVKRNLKIDNFVAACEIMWDRNGEFNDNNVKPLDKSGKKQMIDMYCNHYSNGKDVLTTYTGDGKNDILAIKNTDLGISYNGHDSLSEVADLEYSEDDGFLQVAEDIVSYFDQNTKI